MLVVRHENSVLLMAVIKHCNRLQRAKSITIAIIFEKKRFNNTLTMPGGAKHMKNLAILGHQRLGLLFFPFAVSSGGGQSNVESGSNHRPSFPLQKYN